LILGICDRFHKLPSEVYREDAGLLRLLTIESLVGKDRQGDHDFDQEGDFGV
jgi:hypothetical protein